MKYLRSTEGKFRLNLNQVRGLYLRSCSLWFKGGPMGILDLEKLERRLRNMKARDVMSRFAITIKEHETMTNLAHLMMRFKVSGVPVINKNGDICGIATATDLFNLMKSFIKAIDQGIAPNNYIDS